VRWVQEVALDSKMNEEHEIGEVHEPTRHKVLELHRTIRAGIVKLDRHNSEYNANNHLAYLRNSDDPCWKPLGNDFQGYATVVGIHDGMHCIVHCGEVYATRRFCGIGMPTEEKHCDVMVPMQEDQLFLSQDNEYSVNKLRHLGENEKLYPQACGALAIHRDSGSAKSVLEAECVQIVDYVGPCPHHATETENTQGEVPGRQSPTQVERLSTLLVHQPRAHPNTNAIKCHTQHR